MAERYQALMKRVETGVEMDGAEIESIVRGVPEIVATLAQGLG